MVAVNNPVPPSVRVWVATLAEADLSLRRWLDPRERDRFLSYEGQADQARFLLGAAMLRSAVGQELGMRPEDVPVDRECDRCGAWHGRPRVQGTSLQLSVSHGGLFVVFAMAVEGPVGIDVERIRSSRAIAESWTREEARFKAGTGTGLAVQALPVPWPGHVMSVAHAKGATVEIGVVRGNWWVQPLERRAASCAVELPGDARWFSSDFFGAGSRGVLRER
jgi:phosphopantetheinyl transferase